MPFCPQDDVRLSGLTVSWSTFQGCLESTDRLHPGDLLFGATFPHLSGDSRRALLTALRAVGWLDDGDVVTARLADFLSGPPDVRQFLVRDVLRRCPAIIWEFIHGDAPAVALERAIEDHGVDDVLAPRVARFLVSAAAYAAMPVGSRLQRLITRPNPGRSRAHAPSRAWLAASGMDPILRRWLAAIPRPRDDPSPDEVRRWYQTLGSLLEGAFSLPPGELRLP